MPQNVLTLNPTIQRSGGGPLNSNVVNMLSLKDAMENKELRNVLLQKQIEATKKDQIDYETKLLEYGVKSAQITGFDEYPSYRENMIKHGLLPQFLPESFPDETSYNKWKENAILTASDRIALNKLRTEEQTFKMAKRLDDGTVNTVTVKNVDDYAKYKAEGYMRGELSGTPLKTGRESELGKLVSDRNSLPEGDPLRSVYDLAIAKKTKETGMVIESDGKGGFTIRTNADQNAPLGAAPKGAQTELFKDVVQHQQELDSIRQIRNLYEPEFLSYKGSAKGAWATFMNKLDPTERSQFQERRSAFLSAANKSFIAYRKWATGVAGGEKEMAEIKRATFSEDDSPQDFESKIQLAESMARRLNARIKGALKSGVNNQKAFDEFIKANPLDGIPTMQERGDQLEKLGYKPQQVIGILADEGYISPAAGGAK